LSIARFKMDAEKGLSNNSGNRVIISILIVQKYILFRNHFQYHKL
jgi:hypothetical protein